MMRSDRWTFLVFLALVAPVAAQLGDTDARELAGLPDPPADHILDVGELFTRHPGRRAAISERLMELKAKHDLPVYLAVYAGLIDSTLSRRARLLYDKWVGPHQDGVVVVYNTDTREREIVTPNRTFTSVEGDGSAPVRLQDYQMIPILAEMRVTLRGVEDRIDFIDGSTEILVSRLDHLLSATPAGIADRSILRLVAILLLVGLVITGVGAFAHRRMRVVEERAREQFYFPDVTVGSRLGAPFCGGRKSVVDFSGKQTTGPH